MPPNGSFKELSQTLNTYIVAPVVPLSDDMIAVIDAFYAKHDIYEENDAERVQDVLQSIWDKHVVSEPERYPAFVAIFTRLVQVIHTTDRIFHWWDIILEHMSSQFIKDKSLQVESYQATLHLLMAETEGQDTTDDDPSAEPRLTPFLDRLFNTWLSEHIRDLDDPYQQLEKQERSVLVSFGRRKPKEFMKCLDKFFVKAEFRRKCLILLSDLVQTEPPHLHSVLQTPLFGNLLKCLENDTSTTVINLALTVLIMFLPNIPTQLVSYLAALFNVYARLLFWNTGRTESNESANDASVVDHPLSNITSNGNWDLCLFNPTKDGSEIPQLRNYFTMLYGLYPINLMDYIRKPDRYLRHANAPGSNWVEVQPTEIRQRSERFRRSHMLHPNFYSLTIESEKTDFSRWMSSEVAELVADCMSLCTLSYESTNVDPDAEAPEAAVALPAEVCEPPKDALLSGSPDETLDRLGTCISSDSLTHTKAHGSTTEATTFTATLEEKPYKCSQDVPAAIYIANRPPPAVITPVARCEGEASSLDLEHQVFMLQNELRFEKYLKQQHAAHIGVLRRRLHQQAASEAETQNLLITNRNYKIRLDEAKKAETSARHDYERGRALSMKRESDMMNKNRALREDIKNRKAEIERLTRDVEAYKAEADRLTKLMCTLEERELAHKQAEENMEAVDEEIKRLKAEVTRLGHSSGDEEEGRDAELQAVIRARDQAEAREEEVRLLLGGCQHDLERQRREFDIQVSCLKQQLVEKPSHNDSKIDSKIEESVSAALAASRSKQAELQKQYSILVRKYTALQSSMFDAPLPCPVPIIGQPPHVKQRRGIDEESLGGISRTNSVDLLSPTL